MKSQKAKVLHELGGRFIIAHVVQKAVALQPRKIFVVVGHQAEDVESAVRAEAKNDELLAPVLHFVSVDRGERELSGKRIVT